MELIDAALHVDTFLAVTVGIVVLFIGKRLNHVVPFRHGHLIELFPHSHGFPHSAKG